jgi:hypothetical protein
MVLEPQKISNGNAAHGGTFVFHPTLKKEMAAALPKRLEGGLNKMKHCSSVSSLSTLCLKFHAVH